MAEHTLNFQLGLNASAYMVFDDVTMKLIEVGVNNQTEKRMIIKVSGEKNWIITIPPWTTMSQQIVTLQQPTWNWVEWIDPDSGQLRRAHGGFHSLWTLGK